MRRDELSIDFATDTARFEQAMKSLTASTRDFGRVFASTIRDSVASGKNLEDILKNIARRFSDLALKSALKPLDNLLGDIGGSILSGGVDWGFCGCRPFST